MRYSPAFRGVACLAAACVAATTPWPAVAREGEGGEIEQIATSRAKVVVRDVDGHPVAGATVILHAMDLEGFEGRCVTGTDGRCEIRPLTYGIYRLAVLAGDEAYVGSRTVIIRPKKKEDLEVSLGGFRPADEALGLAPGQPVPDLGRPAAGVARIPARERASGWAWLRTGKGVAAVVGGGALIVAALIAASEDSNTPAASPVQ